ncbi:carbohydrate ABC transporter permease [Alicyclobacillus shizuokensis]|uniref:carbohydrate ABC transporter permease n=1 Tax=Alicyclobacillus shizuokensis TaxID=392014 RepID=UPI00082F5ABB|nr:sugar ABC transporter permease [Alicyclobacillus shizuokensis]MCL6625291.1 sugar ABC transporter permease [Alicyclobacillus shizuokensis]
MNKRSLRTGLLFISPWIVGFVVFTAYPVFASLYYSLTDYSMIGTPRFVGLQNYVNLFSDKVFLTSLANTLYMVVIGLSFITVSTVTIAILLNNRRIKGLSFFRVVFFLPTLVPTVVLSVLWIWILEPDTGLINSILHLFGIPGPGWLASPAWAKPSFILMALWGAGNMIIIYLAGLQDISPALYEAASLDGANAWQKAVHITVPMLRPVIVFNVITGLIGTFQSFAEAFIMTNGGPNNATLFYSLYLYENAFQYFKIGYASAMAWILLIIVLGCTVLLLKFSHQLRPE